MTRTRDFMKTGGNLNDDQLLAMLREEIRAVPLPDQINWLRQVELSLDGYGGEHLRALAERVKSALKRLETELSAQSWQVA